MRHYPRTTLTASLMMLAIAGSAIAGSRDDACAACKSRDVRLCRRLAEQGNTDAQRMLSGIYVFGWGVKKDSTEALKWERLAAEHDPFSQPPFRNEANIIFMYSALETRTFHQEDQTLSGFGPSRI
jgi:hypothetical protein